jgi:hypothetical protein
MRFQFHPSRPFPSHFPALRVGAAAVVVAMGFAVGCDTDEELSAEEIELLEADLADSGEEELANEPQDDEPSVGADGPIDALAADRDPVAFGDWTAWHSEETPGVATCSPDSVATGFRCRGAFCDEVKLECHDYGTWIGTSGGVWSDWFESGSKVRHTCPAHTKITAIDCRGSYCDDIRIQCSFAGGLTSATPCQWSLQWYSEENPAPFYAPVGSAIQGIECSGNHCDNKRFCVVTVE